MPVETKERVIDGHTVMVTQYPAVMAVNMQARLLKFLGEGLVTLLMADKSDAAPRIELALIGLFNKLDPKDMQSLISDLFSCTRVSGTANGQGYNVEANGSGFEIAFAGKLLFMYKCLWFVLEANYSDFLALGDMAKNYGAMFLTVLQTMLTPEKSGESSTALNPDSPFSQSSGDSSAKG